MGEPQHIGTILKRALKELQIPEEWEQLPEAEVLWRLKYFPLDIIRIYGVKEIHHPISITQQMFDISITGYETKIPNPVARKEAEPIEVTIPYYAIEFHSPLYGFYNPVKLDLSILLEPDIFGHIPSVELPETNFLN